jgi:hypothetical protein
MDDHDLAMLVGKRHRSAVQIVKVEERLLEIDPRQLGRRITGRGRRRSYGAHQNAQPKQQGRPYKMRCAPARGSRSMEHALI